MLFCVILRLVRHKLIDRSDQEERRVVASERKLHDASKKWHPSSRFNASSKGRCWRLAARPTLLLCFSTTLCTPLPFHKRVWMRSKSECDSISILAGIVANEPSARRRRSSSWSLTRVWRGMIIRNYLAEWIAEWCLFWVQVLARFVSARTTVILSSSALSAFSLDFVIVLCFFSLAFVLMIFRQTIREREREIHTFIL